MIFLIVNSLFCFLLLICDSKLAPACTTFCIGIENRPVYGRNFDWRLGDGRIFINKRGVVKTAISHKTNEVSNSLSWISKYGSATFNLFGREFPIGGMNEAGLVVESMMLDETQYPPKDSRPEIMASQWIQYQLDNFSKVKDVIASGSKIRIQESKDSKLHFFVCERSGVCATIEFIEGKMIYNTNGQLPVKTLTNSTYAESLSYWRKGELPQFDENKSIERFIGTANLVDEYGHHTLAKPIDYAFDILKSAEHDSFKTQWSIVYDIDKLTIYYRTYDNQKTSLFSLNSFDFSCSTPVKVMTIDSGESGYIADKFIQYSKRDNRNQIRYIYMESYFSKLPDHILDLFSDYPETTFCN